MRAREVLGAALVAAAGVLAACGTTALGPRDEGPAVTNASTVLVPTTTLPAPPAETVTVAEEDMPPTTTSSEATTAPGEAVEEGIVYFIRYGRIEPAVVAFPEATFEPARAALERLLQGPDNAERSLRFTTEIPEQTTIRDFSIAEDGTAIVDLSSFNPPRTQTPIGVSDLVAIYQIVYTLTERVEVSRVDLRVDGAPFVAYFGGQPITRDMVDRAVEQQPRDRLTFTCTPFDEADQPPPPPADANERPFFLGAPRDGLTLTDANEVQVTGVMRLPDDVVVFRLLQYRTEVMHAVSPEGCDGTFEARVAIPQGLTGPFTLEAYVPSDEGTKRFQALRNLTVERTG